ncbi:MAG: rod shape-determining protein MreC [Candidatus Omnitrophota bacterium]
MIPVRYCTSAGEYFSSKKALFEENSQLRKKIAEISLELNQIKEVSAENGRLRALMEFEKKTKFNTVSAEVIARNPNDWIGSFIINKGAKDGLKENSAVCSSAGLLGKITELNDNSSSVMLITHPGFRAGGMLRDSRINGVVAGAGKGLVKMFYIPVDANVAEGAEVITSGYSTIFPEGISIGRVISVDKGKTGLFKCALIKPSADPFTQEEVLCIK